MKIKYLEFTQKTVYDFIKLVRPELPLEVAKYYSKKIKNESYYTALGLLKDLLYQSTFPRYNTGIVQDLMILNDLLTKQNVFTKITLKDGDKELSKELKIKIMRIRMAYTKIKKNFDSEVQEFVDELMTDEFKELNNKTERTQEENDRFDELNTAINSEYQEFLVQKGLEEITTVIDDTLTMDEYSDILDINSGNDVEVNGNKIQAVDFMEIVYDLFVKED